MTKLPDGHYANVVKTLKINLQSPELRNQET